MVLEKFAKHFTTPLQNRQPLISIVTVVYNGASLIEETLRSAVSQTWKSMELVIVDGGSTDDTLERVKQFNPFIGSLVSERDKGIYDAMNKGIALARGEWIYFLNAGDAFYNDRVLETIFGNPIAEDTELLYARVQTRNEPTGVDYLNGSRIGFRDFYFRYPICHQATFTRKRAFQRLGTYNLRYRLAADLDWFMRFFKYSEERALYLDMTVAYYDVTGASYQKRMQGYREFLHMAGKQLPLHVVLAGYLLYPFIYIKQKLIRLVSNQPWFKAYRKRKFAGRSLVKADSA